MQLTASVFALDYAKVESEITEFIRKSVAPAGAGGAVIGLSGGIDSAVVGALCVRALGPSKVLGLLLPATFTPGKDVDDARKLASDWGIRSRVVPIDPIASAFFDGAPVGLESKIAKANVRARIRMTINYYYANSEGFLVAGTGDRSEDMIGYFTKYGDGGVDMLPIAHLYKTQVRALGAHLGLPQDVVTKPSSPQLWPGHRAVDELPIDYDKLDLILYGLLDAKLPPEEVSVSLGVSPKIIEEVLARIDKSKHKRMYPPMVKSW